MTDPVVTPGRVEWTEGLRGASWDEALARMGGHPLQSCLWGDARERVDGIDHHPLAATVDGEVVLLARVEERVPVPGIRVGWIPKGPVIGDPQRGAQAIAELLVRIRDSGFDAVVLDPYRPLPFALPSVWQRLGSEPSTIIVDLTVGRDVLFAGMQRKMRQYVRLADRAGVLVEQTKSKSDMDAFYGMCTDVSESKGFELHGSRAIMEEVTGVENPRGTAGCLFVARYDGRVVAGLLLIRCGESLHEFWSGMDRSYAHCRAGEALKWGVIEWALQQGLRQFDLEGIDPIANPGTYAFKRRLRGQEVKLPGKVLVPFTLAGRLLGLAGRLL